MMIRRNSDSVPFQPDGCVQYSARGFTLIEMMVVVAVLVVMMGVMAPSLNAFMGAQQVKGLAYDLTTDLLLARSEALKRNATVSIARSGVSWDDGWTTRAVVANEIISVHNASAQAVSIASAPAAIVFDVNGRVSAPAAAVRITLSNSSGKSHRCIELDLSGRARSVYGVCA